MVSVLNPLAFYWFYVICFKAAEEDSLLARWMTNDLALIPGSPADKAGIIEVI